MKKIIILTFIFTILSSAIAEESQSVWNKEEKTNAEGRRAQAGQLGAGAIAEEA